MNIEIIAGSPRIPSLSLRVARHLFETLKPRATQHQVGLINMQDTVLPFIQQVWKNVDEVPAEHRDVARRVFNAHAFILVSPEYNGAYSPAMKNFLDHFPKQMRKVFGICTSSEGAMGGMRAAQQMLQLVPALFGIASPMLLITPGADKKFDEAGGLLEPSFSLSVNNFLTEFLWLAEKIHGTD